MQKLIIIVAIIIFLLTLMYPMCYPRTISNNRYSNDERSFHFLFDIPATKAIDVRSLFLSWILLATLTGIASYLARPNSEIRQLIRNQIFQRIVFWLSVVCVTIFVFIIAVIAVNKFYLKPKQHEGMDNKRLKINESLLPPLKPKTIRTENIDTVITKTDPEDQLSRLIMALYGRSTNNGGEVGKKLFYADLNGYSAEQILGAFCKVYSDTADNIGLQEYKKVETTLTLDEMASRKNLDFIPKK